MNKTININLAGIIFHLDERAYEAFKEYLNQIKNALESQVGGAEIIADIEARIAELFSKRMQEFKREAITIEDITFIKETLGDPQEFEDDSNEEGTTSAGIPASKKRLFRNTDESIIGGVAGGIAAYFGTDVVWIRLIFLVLLFFTGIGFITYLILWMAIPEAKTTAQKLQMRGEPVNLSNIERSVKEELHGVKERFGRFREENQGAGHSIRNAINNGLNFIINIVEWILKLVFKIFGLLFIVIGLIIGFTLFIALFGVVASTWNFGGFDVLTIDGNILGLNAAEAILGSGIELTLIRIGTLLTLLFPIFGITTLLARALKKPLANARLVNIVSGTSFIIGIAILLYAGGSVVSSFKVSSTELRTVQLEGNIFDLRAELLEESDGFLFKIDDDNLRIENIKLNIKKSFDPSASLAMKHRARGSSNSDARKRVTQFDYPFEQVGPVMSLSEYFTVPEEALYRGQELEVTLYLPVGSEVYLDPSVENLLYDVENINNILDAQMIGHTWRMERRGLVCLDCESIQYYDTEAVEEQLEGIEKDVEEQIEALELEIKKLKKSQLLL